MAAQTRVSSLRVGEWPMTDTRIEAEVAKAGADAFTEAEGAESDSGVRSERSGTFVHYNRGADWFGVGGTSPRPSRSARSSRSGT